MSECIFCQTEYTGNQNPFFICEFQNSALLLHKNQTYKGRCILVLKEHFENIWEIPDYLLNDLNQDVRVIAESLKSLFNAELINVASLGNQVRHFHYHIIPRYRKDPNWNNPPWPVKSKKMSKKEYQQIIMHIREKLREYAD